MSLTCHKIPRDQIPPNTICPQCKETSQENNKTWAAHSAKSFPFQSIDFIHKSCLTNLALKGLEKCLHCDEPYDLETVLSLKDRVKAYIYQNRFHVGGVTGVLLGSIAGIIYMAFQNKYTLSSHIGVAVATGSIVGGLGIEGLLARNIRTDITLATATVATIAQGMFFYGLNITPPFAKYTYEVTSLISTVSAAVIGFGLINGIDTVFERYLFDHS